MGPIVINVAGGSTTANGAGDFYTFTDSGGNAINLGNGNFKFMRGRTYRFQVGGAGITDGHQMKIYANGGVSADGLGNSVPTTLDAGCLPEGDNTITTNGGNYELSAYNVFDGVYRFTGIPQSNPIAFLNNGVANFNYNVDDSTPIVITVTGGNTAANGAGDFYTFTVDGQAVNIQNGDFKFMRGKTYRFEAGSISGHPFKLWHDGNFVTASNTYNYIQNLGESITVNILPDHPFPVTAGDMLYYQCGAHGTMKADLELSMLDVGGVVYDFYYGIVEVTISGTFTGSVGFTNLAGDITSASGLTYSSSCQVGGADGVAQIDVTIGAGHGIAAGDLYYVHHDAGVADVNMSLTAVDVGGGVIVDHFYGDIDVAVTGDFGDASVRNLAGNFVGGANLITYGQNVTSAVPGVSSLDVKIDSANTSLTTNGQLFYKKKLNGGEPGGGGATYLNCIISLLYKGGADSNLYDYYYGDLNLTVAGDFGDVSVECFHHGAMGGTNILTYTDNCDINLAGTGDANGPATLVVRSFSNTEPRTVELATEADKPVVMSFKNPEKFIFKPVGCDALSAGSGLGGTAGADNRGYYGRGRCKVHYVNKSPQFQPKTYTGTGGYLDKLKRPNTDISFCG